MMTGGLPFWPTSGGGVGRAAGQRDRRPAGEPLDLELRLGVHVDRHVAGDLNQHFDAARIAGDEVDLGNLADADAVELNRRCPATGRRPNESNKTA